MVHRHRDDLVHHRLDGVVAEVGWACQSARAAVGLEEVGWACPTGSSVAEVARSVGRDPLWEDEEVPMMAGPMRRDVLGAWKECR